MQRVAGDRLHRGVEGVDRPQVADVADEEPSAGGEQPHRLGDDVVEVGGAGEVLDDRVDHDRVEAALGKALGTAIIVENKPGANADIGGAYVAHADPDGYTLLLGDLTLATNPSLMRSMPFKPRTDLRAIAPLAVAPLALVVNMSVPAHNMKELLDYARANPDKLSEGTAGRGNLTHLAGEVLKKAAGVKIEQVPYKGSGPALTDLVGGHISMVITGVSSSKGFIKSGQVRFKSITLVDSGAPILALRTWAHDTAAIVSAVYDLLLVDLGMTGVPVLNLQPAHQQHHRLARKHGFTRFVQPGLAVGRFDKDFQPLLPAIGTEIGQARCLPGRRNEIGNFDHTALFPLRALPGAFRHARLGHEVAARYRSIAGRIGYG